MRHFTNIQALRAAAATAVVICHLVFFEAKYLPGPGLLPDPVQLLTVGVDLFFVISGFIITTVSLPHFDEPGAWRRFVVHRFLRIYPIYWFYCLLVLPVFLLRPDLVNSAHGTPDLLNSFLLVPTGDFPLLAVAWSLEYEVFFYAMFAMLLAWVARRRLPLALGLWAVAIVTGRLIRGAEDDAQVWSLVFHPLTLEFLAGCVVALTVARLGQRMSIACTVTALAAMAATLTAWSMAGVTAPGSWARALGFGPAAALLVAGLVGLERTAGLTSPQWMVRLGDASYSLYLSHVLTLSAFGLVCRRLLDEPGTLAHAATLVAAFALAMLGGWVGYRVIEMPLLASLRGLAWPRLPAIQVAAR